ncbi:MAG: MerR family transcriptional regulator [Bacteroidetes bacterium]|jgi:DNA-binding transcriptional MerR regulator|nr:MerR family transcriptional regulator [Bacteroidota bacterium]
MAEDDIQKLYYSIGEVSDLLDLEPHVLRYWESEFAVLHPRKNRAGRRVYTEDDIAVVRRIQHLLKEEKYTIAGAQQVFEREGSRPISKQAFRENLAEIRALLTDLLGKL